MAEVKDRPSEDAGSPHVPPSCAQFFVRADGATSIIEVAGELDLSNVDALAGCLSVFGAGDRIVLDLSNLEFIDSQGISVLVHTCARGVHVTCRVRPGAVRRALEVCGLDAILTFEG